MIRLENYTHMMYVKFDDGETLYFKPHTFSVLDSSTVVDYYRVDVPKDGIELRGSNVDAPNVYWGDYFS
jgi:hypothetical protein